MSYPSEQNGERYWTDYVRVATPIVGLLLLLGVFWFWASSLIGAQSNDLPPTAVLTVVPDNTATATATTAPPPDETNEPTDPTETTETTETTEGGDPPTRTPRPDPTETPDDGGGDDDDTETPTETPEDEPTSCDSDFDEGQSVVVSVDEEGVRMRDAPSTDGEVIDTLQDGVQLTILNCEPEESGGIVWWNVRNEDSGDEGWISQDFIAES